MVKLDIFGGGGKVPSEGSTSAPTLPRDVKEAVSRCRQAVQDALAKRVSRMDVEFPVGTKFGVEKKAKGGKKRGGGGSGSRQGGGDGDAGTPTREDLDTSDRELARLFVDMFQPVGGERISVVFNDATAADAAKGRWKGDSTAKCRIAAMDRRKGAAAAQRKKKKATRAKGFAAKHAAEIDDGDDGTS